jgi:hypothetical protein
MLSAPALPPGSRNNFPAFPAIPLPPEVTLCKISDAGENWLE